jgi:hypothetical protein
MTSLARIAVVALLAGSTLSAAAQTLMDTTVATTTAEELNGAQQARSGTRSAISTVFGAGQGAPGAAPAAPAAAAPEPVAAAPAAVPGAANLNPPPAVGAPTGENAWNAATAGAADAAAAPPPVEGAVPDVADGRRDPFRPFTLSLNGDADDPNAPLSPLQRYELPQLQLAAVVLAANPPRAMLQDNSGMGFIVTPGTPIGRRHGVVKSIEPRRIVVEELVLDYYGRQQAHQVVIEMLTDDKKDDKAQEKQ